MSKQQSVATCSGLGSEFRAKLSVVTFADDDEEAHYEGELKRDELDSFCKYAGLPSNRIASDQDGRTGYDHGAVMSEAMLFKLGLKRVSK